MSENMENINNKRFVVYCHQLKKDGRKYIGLTSIEPEKRWHKGNGYYHNSHFFSAIKKYGWENFEHEIIASNLTENEATKLEQELIAKYKTTNKKYGFNHSTGGSVSGSAGYKWNSVQRKKQSKRLKGRKLSEEAKKHISLGKIGKKRPPRTKEQCEAISKRMKGKFSHEHYVRLGKLAHLHPHPMSEEARKRVGEATRKRFKGKKRDRKAVEKSALGLKRMWERYRTEGFNKENIERGIRISTEKNSNKICQFSLNGEIIKTFPSSREAERQTHIGHKEINFCAKGIYKQAGGYMWKYYREVNNAT